MLKRFYPLKDDHLFLSDSETESDNDLDDHVHDEHQYRKIRRKIAKKSIKKECRRSNKKKITLVVNGESSQDKEAFKEEQAFENSPMLENKVINEAKKYQEYMKQFPVPVSVSVPVSEMETEMETVPVSLPFITWQKLAESMKKKYGQPLHYLTQIILKQWDESRGNSSGNNEVMEKPIGNVIDPSKAEATIWVVEQFNRQFASHHYIAKLWLSDPNYHDFVDANYSISPPSVVEN